MNSRPFFSIITVCFKDKDRLGRTIESVKNQTLRDFEYVIIDGASNDGTLELVAAQGSLISRFICEPDRGIYDAMNKGLNVATGHYVYFLNAGDLFTDRNVLDGCKDILLHGQQRDVILGPVWIKYPGFDGERLSKLGDVKKLWRGLPTSHQGIMYSLDLVRNYPFDLSIKIAADFDQYLRVNKEHQVKIATLNFPIAIVEAGGVSDVRRFQSRKEYLSRISAHLPWRDICVGSAYQLMMMAYDFCALLIKNYLPKRLTHSIRTIK